MKLLKSLDKSRTEEMRGILNEVKMNKIILFGSFHRMEQYGLLRSAMNFKTKKEVS
jgi:predicted nucleotidyltransferase